MAMESQILLTFYNHIEIVQIILVREQSTKN